MLFYLKEAGKVGSRMERGALIGRGNTAEVFEWAEGRVLKLFYADMPSEFAEFEYRIAKRLEEAGVRAPRVFEKGSWDGRAGVVAERMVGPTMLARLAEEPGRADEFGREMARLQVEMHRTAGATLPRLKVRIAENIGRVDVLDDGRKNMLLDRLDALPDGNCLLHMDFHPENILYTKKGPVVIDWLTAVCGHPLADVARTGLILQYAALPEELPEAARVAFEEVRKRMYQAYIEEYARLTDAEMSQVEAWESVLAAARLMERVPESERTVLLRLSERL